MIDYQQLVSKIHRTNREFDVSSMKEFTFSSIKIGQLFCFTHDFTKYGVDATPILIKISNQQAFYLGNLSKMPIEANEIVYLAQIN